MHKTVHVFDYPSKGKIIVIKQTLKNQLIPGFFHKFKTYHFLTHGILDKLAIISTEALFGSQPYSIIAHKIMRNKDS
jgi:hypothetical protein